MPRLSIVIVTFNSRGDLEACLGSLTRDAVPRTDHEIVLVDNDPQDPAVRIVNAHEQKR